MSQQDNFYSFIGNNPFSNYADFEGRSEFSQSELTRIYFQHNPEVPQADWTVVLDWLKGLGLEVSLC